MLKNLLTENYGTRGWRLLATMEDGGQEEFWYGADVSPLIAIEETKRIIEARKAATKPVAALKDADKKSAEQIAFWDERRRKG